MCMLLFYDACFFSYGKEKNPETNQCMQDYLCYWTIRSGVSKEYEEASYGVKPFARTPVPSSGDERNGSNEYLTGWRWFLWSPIFCRRVTAAMKMNFRFPTESMEWVLILQIRQGTRERLELWITLLSRYKYTYNTFKNCFKTLNNFYNCLGSSLPRIWRL